MRLPTLRLAGADWRDRVVAILGAFVAITAMGAAFAALADDGLPLVLVTSVGASAVMLFAIPSSPLVQPWPVVGGSVVSAAVGLGMANIALPLWLVAGLAVAGAILAMSLLRCLHPPGGALALLGVVGQATAYPLALVAFNTTVLVALGWLFHRVSGHSYPHRAAPGPPLDARVTAADVDAALAELDEPFDVDRADLVRLVAAAVRKAALRRQR